MKNSQTKCQKPGSEAADWLMKRSLHAAIGQRSHRMAAPLRSEARAVAALRSVSPLRARYREERAGAWAEASSRAGGNASAPGASSPPAHHPDLLPAGEPRPKTCPTVAGNNSAGH